jgi:hypothetical protein
MRPNTTIALMGCFCLWQVAQAASLRQTITSVLYIVITSLPTVSSPTILAVANIDTFSVPKPTSTTKIPTQTTKTLSQILASESTCTQTTPLCSLPESTSTVFDTQESELKSYGPEIAIASAAELCNVSVIHTTKVLSPSPLVNSSSFSADTKSYAQALYSARPEVICRPPAKLGELAKISFSFILHIARKLDLAIATTAQSIHVTASTRVRMVVKWSQPLRNASTAIWRSNIYIYSLHWLHCQELRLPLSLFGYSKDTNTGKRVHGCERAPIALKRTQNSSASSSALRRSCCCDTFASVRSSRIPQVHSKAVFRPSAHDSHERKS